MKKLSANYILHSYSLNPNEMEYLNEEENRDDAMMIRTRVRHCHEEVVPPLCS